MNERTLESRNHSLIHIPPYDGLGEFKIHYKHELNKPFPYLLKIKLTVTLLLQEVGGDKKFNIMNVVCKYRIKVNENLTELELGQIWQESAKFLIETFNGFEKARGREVHEILSESAESLSRNEVIPGLIQWFYSNNQN